VLPGAVVFYRRFILSLLISSLGFTILQVNNLYAMVKKEFYRNTLPHFQQPGQAYFITWNLKDAVPPKALLRYANQVREIKSQISCCKKSNAEKIIIDKLVHQYHDARRKYFLAYDNLLHASKSPIIDLSKKAYTNILREAIHFWEGRKISSFAFAVMPNHVHWVLETLKKNENENPVYLQDIMQSVKRYSATEINKLEKRKGALWQTECFDTTLRNDVHLHNSIEYTLRNPVKAGFVKDWKDWEGCWCCY
jgi:putative transposase